MSEPGVHFTNPLTENDLFSSFSDRNWSWFESNASTLALNCFENFRNDQKIYCRVMYLSQCVCLCVSVWQWCERLQAIFPMWNSYFTFFHFKSGRKSSVDISDHLISITKRIPSNTCSSTDMCRYHSNWNDMHFLARSSRESITIQIDTHRQPSTSLVEERLCAGRNAFRDDATSKIDNKRSKVQMIPNDNS